MEEVKGHRRSFYAGVYGCFEYITEPNENGVEAIEGKITQIISELNSFQEDIKMGIA